MSAREDKFLEISHLTKSYPPAVPGGKPAVIVDDFDLSVAKGEFVSLIGHSGCGKSTVLSIAAGLLPPTEGGVLVDGREIPGPGTDRGVVFQSPCLLPWMTALGNVLLGVEQAKPNASRKEREEIAVHYLEAVGLGASLHKKPGDLSGGMRQRVGIARALTTDPKALLMDEPFGALDAQTRGKLQDELLQIWQQQRTTVLFVTHSIDEALLLADRILVFTPRPGRIAADIKVDLPRPRAPQSPAFTNLARELRGLVGADREID